MTGRGRPDYREMLLALHHRWRIDCDLADDAPIGYAEYRARAAIRRWRERLMDHMIAEARVTRNA